MIDLTLPLDRAGHGAEEFLSSVQGNILKGHGRDHTAHLFVEFEGSAENARAWIASLAREELTSAAEQFAQTDRFRAARGSGEPFAGLLLTAMGYAALELPAELHPADPFFRAGMRRHNSVGLDPINDPPPAEWEAGYGGDIHALLLLADDDRARLDARVSAFAAEADRVGVRSFVERGDKLRHDFGGTKGILEIEQFGHQDGVSNPRMVLDEIAAEVAERGSANWDPAAPLSLTFVAEEGAADRYGSYFVFRKLEQNVRRYRELTLELAGTLGVTEDFASALVVGRHRDGTPIVPFTQPAPGADPNDFDFSSDRPLDGSAARLCPFHAHIRRSNPRGDIPAFGGPSAEFERSMRIARRGMTYGDRPDLDRGGEPPEMGVGLLFMSFQANLRQFAIQQAGSDSEDFPFEAAGLEGLTGRALGDPAPQSWPVSDPADPGAARPFRLLGFVKMLGGEYFFAPSLPTLRSLIA